MRSMNEGLEASNGLLRLDDSKNALYSLTPPLCETKGQDHDGPAPSAPALRCISRVDL
jgi:hypothetical protein